MHAVLIFYSLKMLGSQVLSILKVVLGLSIAKSASRAGLEWLSVSMRRFRRSFTRPSLTRNPPGTYEFIMSTIASYLCVKLNVQTQKKSGRNYYLVSMASAKSKKILRAYLDRFPLLTSKYLNYKDWCAVVDLMIKQLHYAQQSHTIIEAKKNGMNDSRTVFNWDHLNLF